MEVDVGKTGRGTFRKRERIRDRGDIDRTMRCGARYSVKGMRLHVAMNGVDLVRALFIPVRRYGNAVRRNRARRMASEAFRLAKSRITPGRDLVFVLYPGTDTFEERSGQVGRVLRLAGILPGGT
ncbi:MAG TPA: ribonuclease P protein component [Magnetospirillaceae bacterium]|nr:ribonuclease P protein component [Magnetospirillaceae bacterium]